MDYEKAEQDIDWIVSALESSGYNTVKRDTGMFTLNNNNRAYVDYVVEALERRGYKVVSRSGCHIGVKT